MIVTLLIGGPHAKERRAFHGATLEMTVQLINWAEPGAPPKSITRTGRYTKFDLVPTAAIWTWDATSPSAGDRASSSARP